MIKLEKKTPAISEIRRQIVSGEIKPEILLNDDFLSCKPSKVVFQTISSTLNAKGPSSGMPALGGVGMRPGGPRGIAAPGQAVRPRGGAPFTPGSMSRGGAVAPRGVFRPIGAFSSRPINDTPREQNQQDESGDQTEETLQKSSVPIDTQEVSAFNEKIEFQEQVQSPQNTTHQQVQKVIPKESNFYNSVQTIEPQLDLSTNLNKTGILVMESSANTTGLQLENITPLSFEANLDDSKQTEDNLQSDDLTKRKVKKTKKKKKKQSQIQQPETNSLDQILIESRAELIQEQMVIETKPDPIQEANEFRNEDDQADEVLVEQSHHNVEILEQVVPQQDVHQEQSRNIIKIQGLQQYSCQQSSQQTYKVENVNLVNDIQPSKEDFIEINVMNSVQEQCDEQRSTFEQNDVYFQQNIDSLSYNQDGFQHQNQSDSLREGTNSYQTNTVCFNPLSQVQEQIHEDTPETTHSGDHNERTEVIQVPQIVSLQEYNEINRLPNNENLLISIHDTEQDIQIEETKKEPSQFKQFMGNHNNIGLENQILFIQKKMSLLQDENKQLREAARQAKSRAQKAEDSVSSTQTKETYQFQLLQAQLKLKDQTIDKFKQDNQRILEEREILRNRIHQLQKESQMFREQMENQLQSIIITRQQMSSFDNIDSMHHTTNLNLGQRTQINHQHPGSGITMSSGASQNQELEGNHKNAEASNQQELRKEMQIMRQQYESQLEDKEIELQNRTKEFQQIERRNISLVEANKTLSDSLSELHAAQNPNLSLFAGSGSFSSGRMIQNPSAGASSTIQNAQTMNSNYQASGNGNLRNLQRQPRRDGNQLALDAGSSQTTMVLVSENFIINSGSENAGFGNAAGSVGLNAPIFMDIGENDEGGREGERYFQEITQDEGTGGESYNQQNQSNILAINHPPQSSSGHSGSGQQQYIINHVHAARDGGRAAAFFGVGGDEQMRFPNHGGGVGDGFDGGYGNAVEEDSADDSQEEYNSEPERVRALDQEEEDPEEEDCYQNFGFSGDSYGQHINSQQILSSNLQINQIKEVRVQKMKQKPLGQQPTDLGGFQDEAGDEEEEMPILGSQGIQSVYAGLENNANDSEPEEGRERDKNHHLKDGDGTGDQNIEGDLDGDGDLSNSSQNEDDIMGDEAHSAPAGGDFQEGDFDGEERSRGEEGGCREMNNDGEDGIEQVDLLDDGIIMQDPLEINMGIEYQKISKKHPSAQAAVESTQNQFGVQSHIGQNKFQIAFPNQKYFGNHTSREQAPQYEEEEGGEGLPNQGYHNGGNFDDGEEVFNNNYEENPFEEEKIYNNINQGYNNNQQHSGQNQKVFISGGFQTSATQIVGQVLPISQKNQNVGAINDFGERPQPFVPIRQNNRQQIPPQSQSQMGQGQSAGGTSRTTSKAGAAASSNQQHAPGNSLISSSGHVLSQEESSNGGASVICQANTVGAAATSARRITANAQVSSMQPGNGGQRSNPSTQSPSMIAAAHIRNPRRGNNKQTRQGGGGGSNMQRQQQTQSSSQTRVQGQGGRNSRGTQRSNQQQFVTIVQVAPTGTQENQTTLANGSSLPVSGTALHQQKQQQQPQQTQAFNSQQHHLYQQTAQSNQTAQLQVMGAPSSQASATGSSMFQQQDSSRQRASGGGTSSPNSSSQAQFNQSNFQTATNFHNVDTSFSEIGTNNSSVAISQMVGNAQSSSMASGGSIQNQNNGSVSMMQPALSQVQHMPASHASTTAKGIKPSIIQKQLGLQNVNQQANNARGSGGSRAGPSGGAMAMRQSSAAMISQQKGVVHTANQINVARNSENGVAASNTHVISGSGGGMDTGSGSGGASSSTIINQQMNQNNRHSSEINAESGSTALTNQTNYPPNNVGLANSSNLVQAASQNQQTNYFESSNHNGGMNLSQASALQQVSSPPSTQQTGGNISQQQHSVEQLSHGHNQIHLHSEGVSAGAGGETDFYVGAVGAPPSRAAVISQSQKGGQGNISSAGNAVFGQTNQGSGAGLSGNVQSSQNNHRMQMSSRTSSNSQRDNLTRNSDQAANQVSQTTGGQQMHQNHQRAAKQSSANNSQSQASNHGNLNNLQHQQYEYGNTSNHQSQNAAGEIGGGGEQQSLERLPAQPQSSSAQQQHQPYINRQGIQVSRICGTTGEQEAMPIQSSNDRISKNNQNFSGGVRGMLQSSGGSGFNNSSGGSFANESTLNSIKNRQQMQRSERQNMQVHYPQGSTQSSIQQTLASDQSRGQQMNSQPNQWLKRNYNFEDPQSNENLNNSIQASQMHSSQAASGPNTVASQLQRQDSRKTSGANTPSKDGADTPPYRNDQSHQQKRANDSQIFNLTSKKLLVLQSKQIDSDQVADQISDQEDAQRDGSASMDGQGDTTEMSHNLFE